MSQLIREIDEQDRPRERLIRLGAHTLSDVELLAILLRVGIRGKSAVELSRELIAHFHGLPGLVQASYSEMARIRGIGPAKAAQLKAAFEIAARHAKAPLTGEVFDTPAKLASLLMPDLGREPRECVRLLILDTRLRLKGIEELTRGTIDQALVGVRDVFGPALLRQAKAVVLAHNHPAGDPSPSEADDRVTSRLAAAARLLDIQFLDHLIIGRPCAAAPDGWFSFRAAGRL
jgi:DNA repair protein RadC